MRSKVFAASAGIAYSLAGACPPAFADGRYGFDVRPSNTSCVAPVLATDSTELFNPFPQQDFDRPISAAQLPGTPSRWYVAQRGGTVVTFVAGATGQSNALDISGDLQYTSMTDLKDSQQWGITGIAIHPNYATRPYLYVAFNVKPSPTGPVTSYLYRFTGNASGTYFDPASRQTLLTVTQTSAFHHFGQLTFGPDGLLYLASGDGYKNRAEAQDPFSLHGKILRISVNGTGLYDIPATNPYADGKKGSPFVYALGFRNPWWFSLDRDTGVVWVGDVGEDLQEEVDKITTPGSNFGWPMYEGNICRQDSCSQTGLTFPVYAFDHGEGPAVIGGFIYRGSDIPSYRGSYIFGSASRINLWRLAPTEYTARTESARIPGAVGPTSFYQDTDGEIYVLNSEQTSAISKLRKSAAAGGATVASTLTGTGCFAKDGDNPPQLISGGYKYSVNMPLWSDGANKERAFYIPDGTTISIGDDGHLDFPPGTVLVKNFGYETLHETRLLMYHPNAGWAGYSYEWRADGSEADLVATDGKDKVISRVNGDRVTWHYPSRGECFSCHTAAAGYSLGPTIPQLNRDQYFAMTDRRSNQLATFNHIGLFLPPIGPFANLPAFPELTDASSPRTLRARAYLDANCSMCHRPNGGAQSNSDFRYSRTVAQMNVCNEAPAGTDLGIDGARLLVPGNPAKSLLYARVNRRDAYQMPPLATTRIDQSFLPVLRAWISSSNVCMNWNADMDGDGVPDYLDNCTTKYNPNQADANRNGFGTRCDGDFNGDGVVDDADVQILRQHSGDTRNDPGYNAALDLNNDQIIDSKDLAIMLDELVGRPIGPSALKD